MDLTAHVTQDIADLLPQFLRNRRRDLVRLRAALAAHNFANLTFLGEQMYAVGNPYGFRQVTAFGRLIRDAAARQDSGSLAELLMLYEDYLSRVQIEIVERH